MKPLLTSFCLTALALPGFSIDNVDLRHELEVRGAEAKRVFSVRLPASYDQQDEYDYPVLYVLDGEVNLDHASAVASFLAENALIPEMIVVAVHGGGTRAQDYLPAANANDFLETLTERIVPFVEKEYRAAPLRVLTGHSYGGVFVTHAMLERPEAFSAYLAQSPFLDDEIGGSLLARAAEELGKPADRRSQDPRVRFYATLGDEPALSSHFDRLTEIVQNSGLVHGRTFRDETKSHMTTRLVGLYSGLEWAFADEWPWAPSSGTDEGGGDLVDHLEALSERYGYPVLASESAFQTATQSLMGGQRVEDARETAQLYSRQYPRSVLARYLLGAVLAAGGDKAASLEQLSEGIRLYEADPRPELVPVLETMKQMRTALSN